MNKPVSKQSKKERGAVLAVAILITLMLLILSMPFLTKLSGSYRLTEKSYRTLVATNLAEAGIERAIWELNYGRVWTWGGESNLRTLDLADIQAASGDTVGDTLVSIQAPLGQHPFIESTGTVVHVGPASVIQTVRVLLERGTSPSIFEFALFGDEGIDLVGSAFVDSYDSRDGDYGGDNIGEKGHTGTNATHEGCLGLRNQTTIFGSAFVGPSVDPDDVIVIENVSEIKGVKEALDEEKDLPSVPPPEGLPFLGDYSLSPTQTDLLVSDAEYSSFHLRSNSTVTINGDLTIYVSGDFKMDSNTFLDIPVGSSLTLYLGGTFVQHSNSTINNLSQDPTKLLIYGTDTFSYMDWRSYTDFFGAVYAPRAEVVYNSNADFFGSLIGRYIEIDSNATFHYDLALGELDTIGDSSSWTYLVKSWSQSGGY